MDIHNPGCYHDALEYVSKITGIPIYKEITFKSVKEMTHINKKGKRELKYKRSNVWVEKGGKRYWSPFKRNIKGGGQVITTKENVEFPIGTNWDKVGVIMRRNLEEFGVEIKSAGTYNDSLGGGWSCTVPKIRINDKYFAYMECTCGY